MDGFSDGAVGGFRVLNIFISSGCLFIYFKCITFYTEETHFLDRYSILLNFQDQSIKEI